MPDLGFTRTSLDSRYICGHSEAPLRRENLDNQPPLQVDEDGLWICSVCQERLTTRPVSHDPILDLDERLQSLIGKSAGAICRTLELPFVPPYEVVIEAASKIAYDQDMYMSAWLFVTQWQDGSTVWRASDGHATALVTPDGVVNIQNT